MKLNCLYNASNYKKEIMMKKIIFTLIALCMAGVSAFAEDTKFTTSLSGIAYYTNYSGVSKDATGDYAASRLTPSLEYTKGGLKAVVALEIDALWGSAKDSSNDDIDESYGIGADVNKIQVKNAYFTSNVAAVKGLSITAGIGSYDFPLVVGDSLPMASINYKAGMVDLGVYYIKSEEGKVDNSTDEVSTYVVDAAVKFGESTIKPAFFAIETRKAADTDQSKYLDSVGYIPALSANIVAGAFGIDFAGAYAFGENKVAKTDIKAYAFDIAPYFNVTKDIKVTGFFTYVSGDDNTSDKEDSSFIDATVDGDGSGINIWRLYIIEDGGSFTTYSDVADAGKYSNTNGYYAAGLSLEGAFGPVSVKLQGAYVQAAKVASGAKKDMGVEVDANISYTITEGASIYVEGAFLKTGKYYEAAGEKQNASYINVGTSFEL